MAFSRQLALLFAGGLISPPFSWAQSAILPEILGEGDGYVLARSLRTMGQTSQIVSCGLGGVILLVVTPSTLLVIDAVSFAGSAILSGTFTQARPARLTGPRPAVVWASPSPALRQSCFPRRRSYGSEP